MAETVQHDPTGHRFVLQADQAEAVLNYHRRGEVLDLYHVYVPPAARGRGLAQKLARAALEHARAGGLKVIPTCPFVRQYLARAPEFADLVVKA